MWPELLELSFEQLRLLVRNGFLVENEDVGDVIRVNLVFEILQYLRPLLLDKVQLPQDILNRTDLIRD